MEYKAQYCLSVPTPIEPTALGLARGRLDRADTAQSGEGGLAAQSFGVVSCGDEQHGRGVWSDPVVVEELWSVGGEHLSDPLLEVIDLMGELEDAAG